MTAPGKARRPQASAPSGGGKGRDKGTRGGRPEAQPAQQRGGNARRPDAGRAPRGRPAAARPAAGRAAPTVPAAPTGSRAGRSWRWVSQHPLEFFTAFLSVAGLGVSTYLTVIHYTNPAGLYCSESGLVNCTKVTTSAESYVLGGGGWQGIPVAVLGLAFYVFMVAANSPWAWRARWPALRWIRLGSVVAGMVFVLYLIYTELITLNAICLWCTSVHVITFLLFGLIIYATAVGHTRPGPSSTGQ